MALGLRLPELYSAPPPRLRRLPPGPRAVSSAPSLPAGRDGAPRLRRVRRPGRTVLSPSPTAPRRPGGDRPSYSRRSRSAVRSATHPTRLETRTKESNARASQRVPSSPHGAMKVKAGARRSRWDPRSSERGAPPARLSRSAGEVEHERARWYPKDGELCLGRAKPGETLVEARSGPDVQIGRPTWV